MTKDEVMARIEQLDKDRDRVRTLFDEAVEVRDAAQALVSHAKEMLDGFQTEQLTMLQGVKE